MKEWANVVSCLRNKSQKRGQIISHSLKLLLIEVWWAESAAAGRIWMQEDTDLLIFYSCWICDINQQRMAIAEKSLIIHHNKYMFNSGTKFFVSNGIIHYISRSEGFFRDKLWPSTLWLSKSKSGCHIAVVKQVCEDFALHACMDFLQLFQLLSKDQNRTFQVNWCLTIGFSQFGCHTLL